MAKIDMTGRRYGSLVAIKEAPRPPHITSRVTFWEFKCDCGNRVVLNGANVRSGNTQSCGCLQKKITSELRSIDLTGQRFGKLIAIERQPRAGQKTHYLCQCDCGNQVSIDGVNLKRGLTKSCGCNKYTSYAVQEIEKLLQEANIVYKREVTIHINNQAYFIDFEINNGKDIYYIEFDGEQHFRWHNTMNGWNTLEHLKQTHIRDLQKNNYCFNNNIPLIRIPYTLKTIQLSDLILDTSPWLLTKNNEQEYYKNLELTHERVDAEE